MKCTFAQSDHLGPVIKQGWGTKQGGRIKTWKKRWFVLRGSILLYFTKPTPSAAEKGRIDITRASSVSVAPECKKQPAYKITFPGLRIYYIKCPTQEDVNVWIEVLESVRLSKSCSSGLISLDDFEILRNLGRGTSGVVQLVRHKQNSKLYAMKTMNKNLLAENNQIEQVLTERTVLLQTVHPFLVGAHYCFQTESNIFLVLDYVPGGELFVRLKTEGKFTEHRTRLYAAEILLGLGHLHSLGMVYRDLKPENILLDRDGHLKLTDFGLVKGKMDGGSTTSTFCGTPEYIAPEILEEVPYTRSVDWWSFGILVYEMLVGVTPFYNENTNRLYHAILHDGINFRREVSEVAQDLISKLLMKVPGERLGAGEDDYEEVMAHPFFSEFDWEDVMEKRIVPGWVPNIRADTDVSNFHPAYTAEPITAPVEQGLVPRAVQHAFEGFTAVKETRIA
jgi:serine/threonine protein kinase